MTIDTLSGSNSPGRGQVAYRSRATINACVCVLLVLLCQAAAGQVVHSDGEFRLGDDSDWTLHHIYYPLDIDERGGYAEVMQGSGEGNPGNYVTTDQRLGGVDTDFGETTSSWVVLINDSVVYDPSDPELGPLTSLRIGWDVRRSPEAPRRNGRIIAAVVMQDGYIWGAYDPRRFYSAADMDDWVTDDSGVLTETDFRKTAGNAFEQPAAPDFSVSGGPITFGFASGNSCPPTSDCRETIAHPTDFDNYWLEAGTAPLPGQFRVSPTNTTPMEGLGDLDVIVSRVVGKFGAVTVDVASVAGTATEGEDYAAVNETVSFADGEYGDKPVTVSLVADDAVESDETFVLQLSNPTGGTTLGDDDMVEITIIDDDDPLDVGIRLEEADPTSPGILVDTTSTSDVVTDEFPFRHAVQATVVNDGPGTASNVEVEFRLPKIALAAYDVKLGSNDGVDCQFMPRGDDELDAEYLFLRCAISAPMAAGDEKKVPAEENPILVGYADTVLSGNPPPPTYYADIVAHSGTDSDTSDNGAEDKPVWEDADTSPGGSSSGSGSSSGGSGALDLFMLLILTALAAGKWILRVAGWVFPVRFRTSILKFAGCDGAYRRKPRWG